jgi:hypothetical protein
MRHLRFYDPATGVFALIVSAVGEDVVVEPPPGLAAVEGEFDPATHRVDLSTGEVVPYQPPAPSADHEWDATACRWRLTPAAAEAARERAEARARLDAIDRESIRALRAVAAGTDTKADRDRLAALEAEAVPLRSKVNP